jgi:hypothetical protein
VVWRHNLDGLFVEILLDQGVEGEEGEEEAEGRRRRRFQERRVAVGRGRELYDEDREGGGLEEEE